jgi:hypothetical protein
MVSALVLVVSFPVLCNPLAFPLTLAFGISLPVTGRYFAVSFSA